MDAKTRIIDFVLTDKGRTLLSQGQLNFSFFAFSDEGVDYSGSLVSSTTLASASLDEFVRRGFSLEADQRKNGLINNSTQNLNLNSFLYTVPAGSNILPNFYVSISGSASLQRQYKVTNLSTLYIHPTTMVNPLAVIAKAAIPVQTYQDKAINYVFDQNLRTAVSLLSQSQSITGIPISKDFIALDSHRGLNLNNGTIVDISSLINYYIFIASSGSQGASSITPHPVVFLNTLGVDEKLEFVYGLDNLKIEFALKTNNLVINSKSGYLIEVFSSGSDGTLLKMAKNDIVDPNSNQQTQFGFSNILSLLVDQ